MLSRISVVVSRSRRRSSCLVTSISRRRRFIASDATSAPTAAVPPLTTVSRPIRKTVTKEEREAIRAARKLQAAQAVQGGAGAGGQLQATTNAAAVANSATTATIKQSSATSLSKHSRWVWYIGVGLPSALLVWGMNDENSPPKKFADMIGLTNVIQKFSDDFAKPSHEKLLPDWSQMPNVPHDIPIPPTLVLDLENTLVSSTWDRKYGWRFAKRPGVDKFLHDMAQYYEIVLYSPSIDGIADPVVTSLDKDGCIMHRLYRDATYYRNGVHVKDLNRLNRNVKRMIVLDDDPTEVALNPENLIRVKPYTDATDRTDTTLARIAPFLIEIVREGYDDFPSLLEQYQGMDADEIADEQERRIDRYRQDRERLANRGLGGFARGAGLNLPEPELAPQSDYSSHGGGRSQPTAKDLVGAAPSSEQNQGGGFLNWMNKRAKEKEEMQQLKFEKWNQVMMKKAQEKKKQEEEARAAVQS